MAANRVRALPRAAAPRRRPLGPRPLGFAPPRARGTAPGAVLARPTGGEQSSQLGGLRGGSCLRAEEVWATTGTTAIGSQAEAGRTRGCADRFKDARGPAAIILRPLAW